MANDQPRMFRTQLRASHARVTIGIGEIDISADKHVLIIRAARRQNQETQNRKFDSNRGVAKHPLISNQKYENRNPKLKEPAFPSLRRGSLRFSLRSKAKAGPARIRTWDQG